MDVMHSEETEPLSILKLVFGRSRDGSNYAIEQVISLPLRPSQHSKSDFYRIRDDLLTSQPNYISTVLSALGQSIVPIVAILPNENRVRCLGTGFFVGVSGLLITAAHVIIDPIERNYGGVRAIDEMNWDMSSLNLGVMIMANSFQQKAWVFRKIEWASLLARRTDHPLPFGRNDLKLTTDTAICKVEDPPESWLYQPLSVVQPGLRGTGLAVGKSAIAIGYGAMQDVDLHDGPNGIREGDFHFDLYLAKGHILERFADNDTEPRVRTPGPCFSASLRLPAGMSGSPIFDDERIYVHGVVSSGLQDADGPADLGYGSMIANSMLVPIKQMNDKTLIDLLKEGQHGMAKLHIPDA